MDRERVIDLVRKLLNLSSSDNEHEAAAAAAKAQVLLSEYNLSMSDIPELEQNAKAAKAKARTRQRLEQWAFSLARATADAFDCEYFHSSDGYTVFVGVGADQEVCSWTYLYLYKTLLRMGSVYLKQPQCRRLRRNQSKNAARASYLNGVVYIIRQRLETQKAKTPITEYALVPVKKSSIAAAMPENLKMRKLKTMPLRNDDLQNGMRDGQDISLSTPLNSAQRLKLQ